MWVVSVTEQVMSVLCFYQQLEEEQQEHERTQFHAKHPDVLERDPFIPQKENKCTKG